MKNLSFVSNNSHWAVRSPISTLADISYATELVEELVSYYEATGDMVQVARTIIDLPIIPNAISFSFLSELVASDNQDISSVARKFAELADTTYHALRELGGVE